jgi:hypothetical protein
MIEVIVVTLDVRTRTRVRLCGPGDHFVVSRTGSLY